MKRKVVAMTLAITVSLPAAPVPDLYQADAAVIQEAETAGGAVHVDVSDQVIQEGGFLAKAADDGIMPLSDVDDTKKKQVQEKLKEAWDSVSDTCDLTEFQLTPDEVNTIYYETINQYPRYFFLKGGYSYYSTGGLVTRLVKIGYSTQDISQIKGMLKEYDAAVAKVISNADPSWSDMEKALYVNDYLARSCAYDTALQKYNAYDALVGRSAVCQGYALAFRELVQQLGLPCEIVSSKALNHAWDLVKINGSYYHVDVTWNDPVADCIGRARHHYFMKSSGFFKSNDGNHAAADWEITGGVSEAAASESGYDQYFWNASDTGFEYIDGNWYGFDGTDSIRKYTCNGTDFTAADSIQKIEDVWNVIGGSGQWAGKFTGLGAINGRLIYSGSDRIYELDVKTKTRETLFALTQEQKQTGLIYGMNVTPSGEIEYVFASAPNTAGTVCKVELHSVCITFDGNGADGGAMSDMVLLRPGQEYRLSANLFTKKGYHFTGWNTQADGSGTAYEDKAAVSQASVGSGIMLYAQWQIETEHARTETRGAREATCAEEGYTGDIYCLDCGTLVKKGETIPKKTEHSWNTYYTVDKAPTAEEAGQESIHCKNCDAIKDAREIPKLESGEEQVYRIVFDGNGADSGSMDDLVLYTAGQEYVLTANGFAREGYVFKGWNTKADGTGDFYEDGAAVSRTGEDKGDGFTLYAQWEGHEHVIVIRNQKDATCTEDGYTGEEYCEICKEVITEGKKIEKLGHTEVIDEAVAATCTEEGKTQGSHCSRCSVFIKIPETIAALGHDWEADYTVDKAPTAEETGLKSIHCSRCDARKDEQEIPKQTDTEQSYEVTFDGNGADSGSMDTLRLSVQGQSCSLPENKFVRAGYTFTGWNTKADGSGTAYASQASVSYAAGDSSTGITLYAQWEAVQAEHVHTVVTDPAVAATCTEAGKTQGSHCSVCGEVIQVQEKIPALGHCWNSFYTVDKTATYSEAGRESIHCANCNEVKDSRTIPRLSGSSSSFGGGYYGSNTWGGTSGNGTTGANQTTTTSQVNADKSVTTTTVTKDSFGGSETKITTTNPNGSISETTVITRDASGKTETKTTAMNPDGTIASTAASKEDASGRTEIKTTLNPDGSIASETVFTRDASGRTETRTKTTEQIGPMAVKVTETVTTPAGTEKTELTTERRADGAVLQTQVKTSVNGREEVTAAVTNADGSAVTTVSRTVLGADGRETAVKTTTRIDREGVTTGITEKSEVKGLENAALSVTVKKDGTGNVLSAAAAVTRQAGSRNAATLSGDMISQIREAAGRNVRLTMTVQDADGSNLYKLKANTKDLNAGNKLRIYRLKSTGEYIMVNAKNYTVSENGNVTVSMTDKVTYELVSREKAAEINRKILSTVAARKSSASLKKKGSMQFRCSTGLNMQNVKSIRYQTSDKKTAAVSRTGKITGKRAGTATVKAVVTLKNGSSKTISMRVKVK